MDKKPDATTEVKQFVTTLRIIVFSLVMGVSTFLGYAIVMGTDEPPEKLMLGVMMAGFAGIALVARLIVPGIVFRGMRRQIAQGTWQPAKSNMPRPETDEGLVMAAFQTKTILGAAILEGAGFANAYAFLSERQLLSLIITLLLILGIAAHFPMRMDGWLEQQKRLLDEERSLGHFPK